MQYTTKDTGEVVHHQAPHGRDDAEGYSLDGYDWMDAAATTGWHWMSGWGEDGWDAGSWPYVIITLAKGMDEVGSYFGITTYCEGDLDTTFYRSQEAQWDAITRWCHWNWKHGQGDGPTPLPGTWEQLGPEMRRPYGTEYQPFNKED